MSAFLLFILAWSAEEERADRVVKGVAGTIIAIGFLAMFLRWSFLREQVAMVMSSKDAVPGPNLDDVSLILWKVHSESPEIFTAQQVITLPFRGRNITLVRGAVSTTVSGKGGPQGSYANLLFTIARPDEVAPLDGRPEVFRPQFRGKEWFIFAVDAGRFLKSRRRLEMPAE